MRNQITVLFPYLKTDSRAKNKNFCIFENKNIELFIFCSIVLNGNFKKMLIAVFYTGHNRIKSLSIGGRS